LNPTQISASAAIMPSIRVSISVALSSLRMAGSLGAALVAPGAAEVMLSLPVFVFSRRRRRSGGHRIFEMAAPQ
jgi:hypothetical protein